MSELSLKFKVLLNDKEVDVGEVKFNVIPSETKQTEIKTYTTKELAKLLNTHDDHINLLRKNHAIAGILFGKKYIYSQKEVEIFLDKFKGYDLSNENEISNAVREQKKSSTPGK
ncbi:helix-turn-helix domain-containing protein [Anaerorhabdus sp.]|uniref:helix-turn-helix domain-containing protein n=1 Tax=Anaerorhabdus sp. TaxID=1872524 RepID=UPI002FC7CDB2